MSATAVLNINTSAQLALVVDNQLASTNIDSIECVPFTENRSMAVAASLNGGNNLSRFVDTVKSWIEELGAVGVCKEVIWKKIGEI